jgi:hypothetical protein
VTSTAQRPDVVAGASPSRGVNPIVAAAAVALVPVAIARIKFSELTDPDAFWHILGGRHVLDSHSVAGPDPIGHFAANPWVQTDWLTQSAMAAMDRSFGADGVAWMFLALYIAVYLGIYALCRQRAGVLVSGIVAAAGWLGASASLTPRPQVVSFVLFSTTLAVWHSRLHGDPVRRGRPPWVLLPLTWVWASSHGMWFLGPLTGFVLVGGALLDRSVEPRTAARLALVPAAGLAVAAVTPIGPRLLATPFTVNSYAGFAAEWAPADIHQPFVAATVALLVVVATSWALSRARASWSDLLVWLMALGWVLLYSRTVAVGAILVAPLAAQALQQLLQRGRDHLSRAEVGVLAVPAVLTLAVAALVGPAVPQPALAQPTALAEALHALPADTVVLDDDTFGGWLEYTQPRLRAVLDTRTQIYSRQYLTDYLDARAARPGWQGFVSSTGAEAALLRADSPLTAALTERLHWQRAADADGVVLLRAP